MVDNDVASVKNAFDYGSAQSAGTACYKPYELFFHTPLLFLFKGERVEEPRQIVQNCTMTNEQNGLRERKKIALQRLLTDTTIDLFLKHGFHGTTVDRIAEVAGVSRRTFFHYFPAKQGCRHRMVCATRRVSCSSFPSAAIE